MAERKRRECKTSYVYLLRDPISKEVGYVGVTSDPRNRYRQHVFPNLHTLKLSEHPKDMWICSLAKRAMIPAMEILDEVEHYRREDHEEKWVKWVYENEKTIPYFLSACLGRWLPDWAPPSEVAWKMAT